ncbi:hypothetical protein [Rhizobium leguminosarum]|uniref:Uncharacterized protein n=1 Tax=Rhizobium leguminosarum TaxID=384 RepID=A0A6P0B1H0_RHILE|nr:hypothetical protein [Rhizobium leguminosarum]MBY5439864.1 hypothetical protein [Rhizobium leguminosarum]NEI33218.1 hypothetical protein [Rhizobium leguminosarum]NEI39977.1 hypothetical protein [Rhizobium leguminosarum]
MSKRASDDQVQQQDQQQKQQQQQQIEERSLSTGYLDDKLSSVGGQGTSGGKGNKGKSKA